MTQILSVVRNGDKTVILRKNHCFSLHFSAKRGYRTRGWAKPGDGCKSRKCSRKVTKMSEKVVFYHFFTVFPTRAEVADVPEDPPTLPSDKSEIADFGIIYPKIPHFRVNYQQHSWPKRSRIRETAPKSGPEMTFCLGTTKCSKVSKMF